MKLFVWEGVLRNWGPGMAVAMANTVEEARNLLMDRVDANDREIFGEAGWTARNHGAPDDENCVCLLSREKQGQFLFPDDSVKVVESSAAFYVEGGD